MSASPAKWADTDRGMSLSGLSSKGLETPSHSPRKPERRRGGARFCCLSKLRPPFCPFHSFSAAVFLLFEIASLVILKWPVSDFGEWPHLPSQRRACRCASPRGPLNGGENALKPFNSAQSFVIEGYLLRWPTSR